MPRLLALTAAASPGWACHGIVSHVPTHVIAQAAAGAASQTLGLMPLVIVAVVIAGLVALTHAARLAITLMAQLLQVAARMASTLFTLVPFVVVITTLRGHL
jgi:hypothetical protein